MRPLRQACRSIAYQVYANARRSPMAVFGILLGVLVAGGLILWERSERTQEVQIVTERVETVERQTRVLACEEAESARCQRHLDLAIEAMTPLHAHRVFLKHREFIRRLAVRQREQERRQERRGAREGGGAQQTPPASQRPSPDPPGQEPRPERPPEDGLLDPVLDPVLDLLCEAGVCLPR